MNTVLVIGAGASKPYGFPLGGEIIGQILTSLPSGPPASSRGRVLARALNLLRAQGQLPNSDHASEWELAAFRSALLGQQPASIDAFLSRDFGPQTKVFRWIGKLSIAKCIGQSEKWTTLDQPTSPVSGAPPDDWYRQLWRTLNVSTADDFHRLPLKVISFNYDRSFDQFLAERLTAVGRARMERSLTRTSNWWVPGLKDLEQFSVLHPYGTLGRLEQLPYGGLIDANSPESLIQAAQGIAVIGEEREDSPADAFAQAGQWIVDCQRLVFLGFGFDPINMQRLGLSNGLTERVGLGAVAPRRRVFATTYGLEWAERDAVRTRYFGAIESVDAMATRSPISDGHIDVGITQYLRRFPALTSVS